MREIKFRVWNGEMEYIDDWYWFEENGVRDVEKGIGYGHHAIYNLMQFTGLHDKNGREIYEGDIVDGSYLNPMNGKNVMRRYFIQWENGNYRLTFIGSEKGYDRFLWMMHNRIEVIGNIYENPELLK